jgi:hypothetical protein
MKSLLASCPIILLLTAGCGGFSPWNHPAITGSGTVVTEHREVAGFDRVSLSGSLRATAASLSAPSIEFHISGSGNIRIDQLHTDQSVSRISGSGKLDLAGRADIQELRVSGSGHYRAADLQSQSADIRISGSGDATIWVHDRLDASISGSGSVAYYGSPKATQSISGSGTIRGLGPNSRPAPAPTSLADHGPDAY